MEAAATDRRAAGVNGMAVVSLTCAVLAVAGLFFLGAAVLAVFAVGAGHVALHQIEQFGGSGKPAAMAALGLGYAIGVFGLANSIWAVFNVVATH
jgi:hypothetical protein